MDNNENTSNSLNNNENVNSTENNQNDNNPPQNNENQNNNNNNQKEGELNNDVNGEMKNRIEQWIKNNDYSELKCISIEDFLINFAIGPLNSLFQVGVDNDWKPIVRFHNFPFKKKKRRFL